MSGLRRKEVQLVSQLFNLNAFYDRLAPAYAAAMEVAPVWRRYTEAVLPHLPDSGAVLEVGPGPGLLLARLSARYPLAVGLDRSSGMLRQAGRRLIRSRLPVRLSRGDATILPIASGSFDAVAMTFALSAIPDGLAVVREIARVLRDPDPGRGRPGGVLVLVDAGYPGDGNLIGTCLARLWELFGDHMRDEADLMEEAGLEVITRREFGVGDSIRLVVGRKRRMMREAHDAGASSARCGSRRETK